MNTSETHSARLARTIQELEKQQKIEKANFTNGYHNLLQSLKPKNIAREVFISVKESPKLRARAIAGISGLAIMLIAKKIITKKLQTVHTPREKERISQASRIATPLSKILKPVLTILATRLLDSRKRKPDHQHA